MIKDYNPRYYLQKEVKALLENKNRKKVDFLRDRVRENIKLFREEFNESFPLTNITDRNNEIVNIKSKYIFDAYSEYITNKEISTTLEDRCLFLLRRKTNSRTIREFIYKNDYTKDIDYRPSPILDFLSIALGFEGWQEALRFEFDITKKPPKKLRNDDKKEIIEEIRESNKKIIEEIREIKESIKKLHKLSSDNNYSPEIKEQISSLNQKVISIQKESSDNFNTIKHQENDNTKQLRREQIEINQSLEELTKDLNNLDNLNSKLEELHSEIIHNGIKIDYNKITENNLSIKSFLSHNVNFSEYLVNAFDLGVNLKLNEFLYNHKQESIEKFNVLKSILNDLYEDILYLENTSYYMLKLKLENISGEFNSELYSSVINENINSELVLDHIKLGYYVGKGMIDEMVIRLFPDDSYSDETLNDMMSIEAEIKKYLAYYDLEYLYFEFYPKMGGYKKGEFVKNDSNITEFIIRVKSEIRKKYHYQKNNLKNISELSHFIYQIFLLGRDIQFIEFYFNRTEEDNELIEHINKTIESLSILETLEDRISSFGFDYTENYNLNLSIYDFYSNQIKSKFLLDFFRLGYLISKDILFSVGLVGQDNIDLENVMKVRNKAFKKIKLIFLEYNMMEFFEEEYPNVITVDGTFQLNNDIDIFIFKMRNILGSKF